jgi:3D (Asp-Asp-Asp) domain-containing protein
VRPGALTLALVCVAACTGEVGGGGGGGGDDDASPPGADAAPPAPDAGAAGALLGDFKLTYYWVTAEADHAGVADTVIYEQGCTELATVPAAFADSLALEGTGRLLDGRVVNVDGACGCPFSPCFVEVDAAHPWGYGVQNRALVPYRSVAVDKAVLTIGVRYWVAELDGVMMPGDPPWGGFVHDGCVTADDVGGGIDGQHIDFFAALRESYVTLDGELGLATVTLHEGGARCQ